MFHMPKTYTEGKKRARLLPAVTLLLVIVIFSTMWLMKTSQTTTENGVYSVSSMYLEELTVQKARQFTDTLDSQIQQLLVTVRSLRAADVRDQNTMQAYIGEMKEINGFDFFALVDDQGMIYKSDTVFPGISKFDFLFDDFNEPVISFDQSMGDHNMVLIAVPLTDQHLGDHSLIAAMAGMNEENIADRLSLSQDIGQSFSNIVMVNGSYVIQTSHEHLGENTNIFSVLEKSAVFVNGTSLDAWREDLRAGQPGMAAYALQGVVHYTYYMPVEGTDWFIMTTLHYDLISEGVELIRTTLNRNSMVQLTLILLVLVVLLVVYSFMNKRNDSLWLEKVQAEESSKAKSTFLSNMSHDIRTPMNAIIGFANLAVKNVEDPVRTKDYLAKILASSNHLLALINDVLEMSRIESGKIQLEETECNLPELLHDLNTIILGQIQNKQQELLMDAVDVVNENVYCDKLRMNQVLLNLLSNAIKFTPAGGKISVRIEQLQDAPKGYGTYVIRVKDNGIGMKPEFAAKVFTPFERERTSTVSGIQGTGLGMSITKNIIDLMHGTIDVETEKGKGTEFIIKVNLRLQDKQSEPVRLAHLEGVKALVVDDDFDTCDAATRMLLKLGMQPEWTMSGKEAVLKAKHAVNMRETFGLYIIDWQLPDLGGVEVARQIRAAVGEQASILLVTAYDWTMIEKEARAAGVNAFCSKPIFMSDLQAALSRAIGQQVIMPEKDSMEDVKIRFAGNRILLVEDNELNREIAVEILKEAGFEIDEADDGTAAVEKVHNSSPGYYSVVLMDIQMPVMDGYEATKEIRAIEDEALASIPIIAMTANAFEEDRQAALNAGMNGHLAKPVETEKLFVVLSDIIKKQGG